MVTGTILLRLTADKKKVTDLSEWLPCRFCNYQFYSDGCAYSQRFEFTKRHSFGIGALPDRTFGMNGSIDNVRFYNKELTSSEVNTLRTETGPCPVFTPNLSWDLNEGFWDGSADEVLDYSGNNLSGQTMNSVTSSLSTPALSGDPGTCGYAQLNGSNRYIQRASSPLLSPSATLTVSAWVRPTSTPSELMTIVSKDSNYEFHINSSRRIYWWWQDTNNNTRTLTSTSQLPLNQWTHVAIRYSSGNQRIFINGVEDASTSSLPEA